MTSSSLYNIINGKAVNASVNVQETLKMGESMFLDFSSSLPGGFQAPLKRKVKNMEYIKCQVAIGDKTLYDMASLFCFLFTVGQHRQAELQTLFEFCAVPVSIIDEYRCLRTGTKSTLVSKLKVDEGRRSCWSFCTAWSWHTPCTIGQLPAVSSDGRIARWLPSHNTARVVGEQFFSNSMPKARKTSSVTDSDVCDTDVMLLRFLELLSNDQVVRKLKSAL